jgi:signal transduction histidine kinase
MQKETTLLTFLVQVYFIEIMAIDMGIISIENEVKLLGPIQDMAIDECILFLKSKQIQDIIHMDCIEKDYPDFPNVKDTNLAGLLYIPLSKESDFIAFFRFNQVTKVNWAGKFEPLELEIASILQLVYWKFIDIWRQRDAAIQSNRLKNVLLANVSHEVRTPLNSIINYLEMALEQPMDNDLREALGQSHQSSKALIFIINDLLDLTRIEAGRMLFRKEPFELKKTIKDAAKMFEIDAKRKNILFDVVFNGDFPELIIGDNSKIRQIVINLCCNSFKFTVTGSVILSCTVLNRTPTDISLEISVKDTGYFLSINLL